MRQGDDLQVEARTVQGLTQFKVRPQYVLNNAPSQARF